MNKESLSSLGITFGENIDVIQLKNQLLLQKNEACVWRRNTTCDQTQVCEKS